MTTQRRRRSRVAGRHQACRQDESGPRADSSRELRKVIIGQEDVIDQVLNDAVCRRQQPDRRRAGSGEDAADSHDGAVLAAEVLAHPVHARPDAVRHHRHRPRAGRRGDRPPADGVRARADLREHRARGRNQPHAAEDAVGAARSDAGASRHRSRASTYQLDEPFYVFATQNPIELEGTYPLPEAQLDRFMFHIIIEHPPYDEELDVVRTTTAIQNPQLERPVSGEDLIAFQQLVRKVPVAEPVMRHALDIVRATRPKDRTSQDFINKWVAFGASVRAAQYLVLGGKARALTSGRYHVSFDDIRALAHPVLRHRIITNFHAQSEGVTTDQTIVDRLLRRRLPAAAIGDVDERAADSPERHPRRAVHGSRGARAHREPGARVARGRRRLHQRPAQGAVLRRLGRLRRAPRLRAGRRHPPHGLEAVGAHRPLLHQGVRSRDEHELLGAARRVEVDGLRQPRHHQVRLRAHPHRVPDQPRAPPARPRRASWPSTTTSSSFVPPSAKHMETVLHVLDRSEAGAARAA